MSTTEAAVAQLRTLAQAREAELTPRQPADRQLAAHANATSQPEPYKQFYAPLRQAYATLLHQDEQRAQQALRWITARALMQFDLRQARLQLPLSIQALYPAELTRVLQQLAHAPDAYYALDNDPWTKDFALLTHRFIPLGAEFAALGDGVPRSALLKQGVLGGTCAAWRILTRAGGLRPFIGLHMHPLSTARFNPEGWNATYHRLGELLAANPGLRGMVSSSWFLDPKIAAVSPRLAYLRAVPEAGGAIFLHLEDDRRGESGALTKSATRRALFEAGKYVPATYMRAWARRDILAWCARHPEPQ